VTQTLFVARRIHTMDPASPDATGVMVADGRVTAVGDGTVLQAEADRVVDLGDAVLTPGLVDGHTHPVHGLEVTAGVDLSGLRDLHAVRAALEIGRKELEPGQWLQAWGLNPVAFGGATPSADALGPAFAGVPAYVVMYDAHAAIASHEALAIAGVDGRRAFTSNAEIDCDADGRPTGYLLESEASELARRHIPEPTLAELNDRFHTLLHAMAASGLTGMHAMDFAHPTRELCTLLEEAGDLPVKIGFNPMLMPDDDGTAEVLAVQGLGGRRWKVEGVKLFVDGTIDGGTAWLEYADTHGHGLESMWRDFDRFRETVTGLHRAGVNCAVHAIGDRGVREVVELFAALRAEFGPLARHRIEHIETIPDEVVAAFAGGAASASMQPLHCTFFNSADRSDSWSQRLGDVRVDHGFRWRDLRSAGAVVALGSDWPIAPYDPRWTLADAQLRRHFDDFAAQPMQPAQALTARQALEGYTTHAALASGEEPHRGRIAPGFDADFTVFGDDPLSVAPASLATLAVLATVLDGEMIER
jgi:predicted amidohydrolase YtcJ